MNNLFKIINYLFATVLIGTAIFLTYIAVPYFGNKALIVKTGSMSPNIKAGDLVVVNRQKILLTPQPIPLATYHVGDIIAFKDVKNTNVLVTHRIVKTEKNNGKIFFQTKGDANNTPDTVLVPQENVIGKSTLVVPKAGKLFAYAKTKQGFALLVLIPAILVIFIEFTNLVKEFKRLQRAKQISAFQSAEIENRKEFLGPIGLRVLIPFVVGIMFFHNSYAFFSDSASSFNNIFQTARSFCQDQGEIFAQSVTSSNIGFRKDGSPVEPTRTNPNDALGSPDGVGNPASGFFSLGFGGTITVDFGKLVGNGEGADLSFHEVTNGRATYPLETANVEVSADNITYYSIGSATSDPGGAGIVLLDISSNPSAPTAIRYVRITDTTNPNIHVATADGYDLDAVDAKYPCPILPTPAPSPSPEASASSSPSPLTGPEHNLPSPAPSPKEGDVVINEINWAGSNSSADDEWIELKNTTDSTIDLANWVIENLGDSGSPDLTISSGSIPANGYFLISHFSDNASKINTAPNLLFPGISLANGGEELKLKSDTSVTIDTANIIGSWFEGSNTIPKKSMERTSPSGDGSVSTNWQTAVTHVNMDGSGDSEEFGTPRAENGL